MFDAMICKSPDVPLQDELLCWTLAAYAACYLTHICHVTVDDSTVHYLWVIMLVARLKWALWRNF